jgi:hypothetical protein
MSKGLFRSSMVAVGVMTILMISTPAQAQRGRVFGPVSRFELATLEPVKAELKLSDTQQAKATELAEKLRSERRAARDAGGDSASIREKTTKLTKELTEQFVATLDESQRQRLTGIFIQVNGASALQDDAVAAALNITDAQKQKLADLRDSFAEANRNAFQDFQNLSDDERREKLAALRNDQNEKAMAELTAEQREKIATIKGAPVEVDLSSLRGGRGGRQQ